jgi:periplasmic divalent cation tolerance protein
METQPIIVFVTAPSSEKAREIALSLVQKKLAACVNIVTPINSIYLWEGQIQDEQETLLIIKSRSDLFEDDLAPAIRAIHPYQVPEIIALPIEIGSKEYLDWIRQVTRAYSYRKASTGSMLAARLAG